MGRVPSCQECNAQAISLEQSLQASSRCLLLLSVERSLLARSNCQLLCRKKEARKADEKLRNTKTLGEQAEGADDLMSWVQRSRTLDQERAKAQRTAKQFQAMVSVVFL